MNPTRSTTRFAPGLVVAAAPCGAAAVTVAVGISTAGASTPAASAAPERTRDMIAELSASGPHASLGDQAALFDRFVGTWDCDFAVYTEGGSVQRLSGEVRFGWVLDGWVMQDIWIGYPEPGSSSGRDIGTTVRFFDKESGVWRVIWVAASRGYRIELEGGAQGDRIVLRGKDRDGSSLRWSFNDIRADAFVWRGESSHDGGKTWWMQEEHQMRRRTSKGR